MSGVWPDITLQLAEQRFEGSCVETWENNRGRSQRRSQSSDVSPTAVEAAFAEDTSVARRAREMLLYGFVVVAVCGPCVSEPLPAGQSS